MIALPMRAGRWPLAFALAVLGACADEPSAPTITAPAAPNANVLEPFVVANANDAGIGSLRWVLRNTTGGETVRFDPSLAGQTITIDSTLYLQYAVTIEGPAGAGITINGAGKTRVLYGGFPGTLTLRNLTITGGNSAGSVGGAMNLRADLALENTTIHGNAGGAAVAITADTITLTNSTVSGNTSTNALSPYYGAVFGTEVRLVNSTITNNQNGGVAVLNHPLTLRNSIVAKNGVKNCVLVNGATLVYEGKNLSDDDSCGIPSEILIGDAKLGPLADNGGPSMTHALLAGSPAINTGVSCGLATDQRYFPRDAQCDLGAFEFADFTTVTVTIDPTSIVKQSTGGAVLTGTVTCSRDETFELALELSQAQKSGKTTTDAHAATTLPVQCTTTPRMWSASMVLTEGAFQAGSASATAQTFNAEPWVTPASASAAVKLFRSK